MDLIKLGKYKLSVFSNSSAPASSIAEDKSPFDHFNTYGNINLLTNYKFADVVLFQIIKKLTSAMSGFVWSFNGRDNLVLAFRLKMLFEKNFALIYKKMYFDGVAVFAINYEANDVRLLDRDDYKMKSGKIEVSAEFSGYNFFTVYSDTFKIFEKTDFDTCRDLYLHIDNLLNAINATTENLGAMGILSPEVTAGVMAKLGDPEKERIQKEWRERYGLKVGKWSIMISNTPTRFQQINLPIKDLELQEKLKNAIQLLAGYHEIPYELIATSGQSTFANRFEARNGELLGLTCTSYANKLFDLATEIFFAKVMTINYKIETKETK